MIGKFISVLLLVVVAFLAITSGHLFVLADNAQRTYALGCNTVPGTLPDTVPEPLNSIVTKAAAEYNTDPVALAVLFHNENGWTYDREPPPPYGNGRPWPTSSAAANGPFQFTPGTWLQYRNANPAHQPGDINDLTDAAYAAAQYLSDLGGTVGTPLGSVERIKEKPTLLNAIVSYHSGSANNLGPRGREYARNGYDAYRSLQASGGLNSINTEPVLAISTCAGDGSLVASGEWHPPITDSYRISSPYGWRIHPTLGTRKHHNGIDLAAPCGTAVHAVADSTVTRVGWNGSYGNMVSVDHGDGIETGYAHLEGYAPGIGTVIKTVSAGDIIGYVGTTGRSTGCHLDTQVKVNGDFVDPVPFYRDRRINL